MPLRSPTPGLEDVIRAAVKAGAARMHTSAPAFVLSYDRATQTAKVQLIVRGRKRDTATDEITNYTHPPLIKAPVAWPAAGDTSLTMDLEEGDVVMVCFAERSLTEWKATGDTDVSPRDPRRFDIQDAWIIPGCQSPSAPLPAAAVAAGAVVFRGDDIRMGSADAEDFVSLARLVDQEFARAHAYLQALYQYLASIQLPVAQAVAAFPPGTVPAPPTFQTTAATKVKAE